MIWQIDHPLVETSLQILEQDASRGLRGRLDGIYLVHDVGDDDRYTLVSDVRLETWTLYVHRRHASRKQDMSLFIRIGCI